MRNIFVTMLLFFFIKSSLLCAQNSFVRIYDIAGMGEYVQQTSDGGFIILTNNNNISGILKTNANGDSLWSKSFLGLASHRIHMNYLQQTKDSGYIFCGTFGDSDSIPFPVWTSNIYILRTNSLGDSIWSKIYDLSPLSDIANYIEETSDSGFILTGSYNYELNTGSDILFMKINSNGDTLWTKIYGNPGQTWDNGYWIYETPDSGYIAGANISDNFSGTSLLMKMNNLGDTLWTKKGVSGTYSSKCSDGGLISGADLWVSVPANDLDIELIKTDSVGNVQWNSLYGCSGYDDAFAVQQTFDDNFICLARNINSCVADTFYYLLKTNFLGDSLTAKSFPSNYNLRKLSLCQDNGFVLTGAINSGNSAKVIIVKTDNLGNFPVSIENIKYFPLTISIYPNPAVEHLYIDFTDRNKVAFISLYDVAGQTLINKQTLSNGINILQISPFAQGMYFYRIFSDNEMLKSGKIVIQK